MATHQKIMPLPTVSLPTFPLRRGHKTSTEVRHLSMLNVPTKNGFPDMLQQTARNVVVLKIVPAMMMMKNRIGIASTMIVPPMLHGILVKFLRMRAHVSCDP